MSDSSPNIQVVATVKLTVGDVTQELTREAAEKLFWQLREALNINIPIGGLYGPGRYGFSAPNSPFGGGITTPAIINGPFNVTPSSTPAVFSRDLQLPSALGNFSINDASKAWNFPPKEN